MTTDRRSADRFDVTWSVDCVAEDNFLYASITNISAMGIFVKTTEPLPVGTKISLAFTPPEQAAFSVSGIVQWINPVRESGDNPNPGMGVRFVDLSADDRERLVEVVHAIAYLNDPD